MNLLFIMGVVLIKINRRKDKYTRLTPSSFLGHPSPEGEEKGVRFN
jgi:hypothetical protein